MTPELRLADAFLSTRPAQAARLVDGFATDAVLAIFELLPAGSAACTLQHMLPSRAAACVRHVEPTHAAAWVERLPLAVAATLLRRLEPERSVAILQALPAAQSVPLRLLLEYPPQTVGAVMDPRVEVAPLDATIEEGLRLFHQRPAHVYYYVYVVDPSHRLAGVLDLAEMLQAPPGATLSSVMTREVARLVADMPVSNAVAHPAWSDLDALPVVTADGVFLGMLRHRTVRQLQLAETRQDGGEPTGRALVSLGELYWLGLTGLLQGLASTAAALPASQRDGRSGDGR
jgi:magnesium transporter